MSSYASVFIYKQKQEGPWEADSFNLAMLGRRTENPVV
jgi:hypothetical protein